MATLSSTFFLKKPKSDSETLILFSCYFKHEEKKFVYSTGEKIHPKNWDFKSRQPFSHGNNKHKQASSIAQQINRYRDKFEEIQARNKAYNEDFTTQTLRDAFDKAFKRSKSGKDVFFKAFDEFIAYKSKSMDWSSSTLTRYKNVRGILKGFEDSRKYKLSFNTINSAFHAEFTDYCMSERKHINNTFSRNLGLFKTFMYWALENGFTYKEDFKKFKKKERVITHQIALKLEDLQKLMEQRFPYDRLERARDVFVFACITGMRYGELSLINKNTIQNNKIYLKEEKDADKATRTIPLNDLSLFILRKYDYALPLIANQKQNLYLKELFKIAGFDHLVEKTTTRGKENLRETMPFYDRISTHTARRTFITMMKRKGVSDKLIASITGHRDMKTLNQYYQVDEEAKTSIVNEVFNMNITSLKKVV